MVQCVWCGVARPPPSNPTPQQNKVTSSTGGGESSGAGAGVRRIENFYDIREVIGKGQCGTGEWRDIPTLVPALVPGLVPYLVFR